MCCSCWNGWKLSVSPLAGLFSKKIKCWIRMSKKLWWQQWNQPVCSMMQLKMMKSTCSTLNDNKRVSQGFTCKTISANQCSKPSSNTEECRPQFVTPSQTQQLGPLVNCGSSWWSYNKHNNNDKWSKCHLWFLSPTTWLFFGFLICQR